MPGLVCGRILVPIDFSDCSKEAFRIGCSLARMFSAEVILVHVVDIKSLHNLDRLGLARPTEEKDQKKRLHHQARLLAREWLASEAAKGVPMRRLVVEGVPFVEIVKTARTEKVNLIVLGSYGEQDENVEKIFFGSTAERVVRTAGCSVLTIPWPAAVKPKGEKRT